MTKIVGFKHIPIAAKKKVFLPYCSDCKSQNSARLISTLSQIWWSGRNPWSKNFVNVLMHKVYLLMFRKKNSTKSESFKLTTAMIQSILMFLNLHTSKIYYIFFYNK